MIIKNERMTELVTCALLPLILLRHLSFHHRHDAVEVSQVLGGGVFHLQHNIVFLRQRHEDGSDAERVEFREQEVGIEVH